MKPVRSFLAGLAFLTRLWPGKRVRDEEFAACMPYLPLVGLALGLIVAAPFWLGLFNRDPWIQAWLAVVLSVFLTRGLHLDGLADICDGMASHFDPARFWVIVKDSHIGVFGAAGVALAVSGQAVLFHALCARQDFGGLAFAFVFGRGAVVALGFFCRGLTRPGLGGLFIKGAGPGALALAWLQVLAIGLAFASPQHVLLAHLILAPGIAFLARLARKVGGINGDFLGASVIWGEIAACLGLLL